LRQIWEQDHEQLVGKGVEVYIKELSRIFLKKVKKIMKYLSRDDRCPM